MSVRDWNLRIKSASKGWIYVLIEYMDFCSRPVMFRTVCIKPKLSHSGGPSTRVLRGSGYRHTVHVPTRWSRAFGDVHAKGTWHHTWKRLRDLVKEVERHMQENGSGQYKLSQRYDEPEVTAAVENLAAEQQSKLAV